MMIVNVTCAAGSLPYGTDRDLAAAADRMLRERWATSVAAPTACSRN
jgi:hypothetical protein